MTRGVVELPEEQSGAESQENSRSKMRTGYELFTRKESAYVNYDTSRQSAVPEVGENVMACPDEKHVKRDEWSNAFNKNGPYFKKSCRHRAKPNGCPLDADLRTNTQPLDSPTACGVSSTAMSIPVTKHYAMSSVTPSYRTEQNIGDEYWFQRWQRENAFVFLDQKDRVGSAHQIQRRMHPFESCESHPPVFDADEYKAELVGTSLYAGNNSGAATLDVQVNMGQLIRSASEDEVMMRPWGIAPPKTEVTHLSKGASSVRHYHCAKSEDYMQLHGDRIRMTVESEWSPDRSRSCRNTNAHASFKESIDGVPALDNELLNDEEKTLVAWHRKLKSEKLRVDSARLKKEAYDLPSPPHCLLPLPSATSLGMLREEADPGDERTHETGTTKETSQSPTWDAFSAHTKRAHWHNDPHYGAAQYWDNLLRYSGTAAGHEWNEWHQHNRHYLWAMSHQAQHGFTNATVPTTGFNGHFQNGYGDKYRHYNDNYHRVHNHADTLSGGVSVFDGVSHQGSDNIYAHCGAKNATPKYLDAVGLMPSPYHQGRQLSLAEQSKQMRKLGLNRTQMFEPNVSRSNPEEAEILGTQGTMAKKFTGKCFNCGEKGHSMTRCPYLVGKVGDGSDVLPAPPGGFKGKFANGISKSGESVKQLQSILDIVRRDDGAREDDFQGGKKGGERKSDEKIGTSGRWRIKAKSPVTADEAGGGGAGGGQPNRLAPLRPLHKNFDTGSPIGLKGKTKTKDNGSVSLKLIASRRSSPSQSNSTGCNSKDNEANGYL